jgi:hypothetical protein
MCHVMVASSVYGRSHKKFWARLHNSSLPSTDFSQRRPLPPPKKFPAAGGQGKNGEVEALGNFLAAELSFQGSDTRK